MRKHIPEKNIFHSYEVDKTKRKKLKSDDGLLIHKLTTTAKAATQAVYNGACWLGPQKATEISKNYFPLLIFACSIRANYIFFRNVFCHRYWKSILTRVSRQGTEYSLFVPMLASLDNSAKWDNIQLQFKGQKCHQHTWKR